MQIYKVRYDKDLAQCLGINSQNISTWRQMDSTPFELCISVAKEKGVDLNWLLTGEGDMIRNMSKEESAGYQIKPMGTLEQIIERLNNLENEVHHMKGSA
jgi:hypothetical protein